MIGWGRRAAQSRLRRLGVTVPRPFSIDALSSHISDLRARPIVVLPMDINQAAAPCGMWIATAHADYVFFAPSASPVLQIQAVLHEFGHILCGHRGPSLDAYPAMFDMLDPGMVEDVLGRRGFDDRQERQAEEIASVMMATVVGDRPAHDHSPDDRTRRVLDSMSAVLAGQGSRSYGVSGNPRRTGQQGRAA